MFHSQASRAIKGSMRVRGGPLCELSLAGLAKSGQVQLSEEAGQGRQRVNQNNSPHGVTPDGAWEAWQGIGEALGHRAPPQSLHAQHKPLLKTNMAMEVAGPKQFWEA